MTTNPSTPTPNPAALAAAGTPATVAAGVEKSNERDRLRQVRQRRRLRAASPLTGHLDKDTAIALSKIVHPDQGHAR